MEIGKHRQVLVEKDSQYLGLFVVCSSRIVLPFIHTLSFSSSNISVRSSALTALVVHDPLNAAHPWLRRPVRAAVVASSDRSERTNELNSRGDAI